LRAARGARAASRRSRRARTRADAPLKPCSQLEAPRPDSPATSRRLEFRGNVTHVSSDPPTMLEGVGETIGAVGTPPGAQPISTQRSSSRSSRRLGAPSGRNFGTDVQGTKTSARVEQIVRPAQQANVLRIGRSAFGKRLHVIELDKPSRRTAPAIWGDEGALPALPNVRRSAHSDRQVASARVGTDGAGLPFDGLVGFDRRRHSAWRSAARRARERLRLIARAARVAQLDADPEASLLLPLNEASRQQLDQAPEIALGESMTGELAGALEQIAQLGISGEVHTKAVG